MLILARLPKAEHEKGGSPEQTSSKEIKALTAGKLDATAAAEVDKYVNDKWEQQTLYLAGVDFKHASVRYIRGFLYGKSGVGEIVSVNVSRVPASRKHNKSSWAFVSFASRPSAQHVLSTYHEIRGLPSSWRLSCRLSSLWPRSAPRSTCSSRRYRTARFALLCNIYLLTQPLLL